MSIKYAYLLSRIVSNGYLTCNWLKLQIITMLFSFLIVLNTGNSSSSVYVKRIAIKCALSKQQNEFFRVTSNFYGYNFCNGKTTDFINFWELKKKLFWIILYKVGIHYNFTTYYYVFCTYAHINEYLDDILHNIINTNFFAPKHIQIKTWRFLSSSG